MQLQKTHGVLAAGHMGEVINRFFGIVIETVAWFGGDVMKFSGDALTIFFPGVGALCYFVLLCAALCCALLASGRWRAGILGNVPSRACTHGVAFAPGAARSRARRRTTSPTRSRRR